MWTHNAAIESDIPIYCTATTYDEIKSIFAYLVSKNACSGGGNLPAFRWHVFNEHEPLEMFGVRIVPLPVHHGWYFTTPPKPLISLGFLIDSSLLWMTDIS